MEAKQKVARVKTWKKIAKCFKKEEHDITLPTNNLNNALESIPEADAVDIGLLGPLLKAYTINGLQLDCSPQPMRRMTNEAHRTWQRGTIVMEREEDYDDDDDRHFPKLRPISNLQPLMFDQLQPTHPYFHNIGTTPENSHRTTPAFDNYGGRNSPPMIILPT